MPAPAKTANKSPCSSSICSTPNGGRLPLLATIIRLTQQRRKGRQSVFLHARQDRTIGSAEV